MKITNQQLHEDLQDLKEDVRFIKKRLLDPDDGAISRINKNTALIGIIGKLMFWN